MPLHLCRLEFHLVHCGTNLAIPSLVSRRGRKTTLVCVMAGNFLVEAVTALLNMARATSDPSVSAALLDKAAELNERVEDAMPSTGDTSAKAPDVITDQST